MVAASGVAASACGSSPADVAGAHDASGNDVRISEGGGQNEASFSVGASQGTMGGDSSADSSPVDASSVRDASLLDDASSADAKAADAAAPSDAPATDAVPGCGNAVLDGGPLRTSTTHLNIGVHDPSMIWDGHLYYLFATGGTLDVRTSPDMLAWTNAGNVFSSVPAWIGTGIGSAPTDLWAPDVSYFNGQFHVYYAGSMFSSNDSVIGLATTASLSSPSWRDQGMVVESTTRDDFNAIDPNLSFDENCTPWLAFGSFWSGIKLRQIDPTSGRLATNNTTTYSLASRNGGAIEAASIVLHNGYYYLFVSFDLCCKGVDSTYRTMVGRASQITGPYTDKAGNDMMTGAAEQILATSGRYIGPGGGTAWTNGDTYLYVYHYYDGDNNGAPELQVRPIVFDSSDWLTLGDPLFP
jgi:arabinan endo-1,5-alpha-L-arabinosidase